MNVVDHPGAFLRDLAAFLRFRGGSYPIELQVLDAPDGRWRQNRFAHARDEAEALRLAAEADRWGAPGVYLVAGQIDPAVATRAPAGRWHPAIKGESTSDSDIRERLVLFVDVDPRRARGTSATDAECSTARDVAELVMARLVEAFGAGAVASGSSGNGVALFVALDGCGLCSEPVKSILASLDALYSSPAVHVDPSVSDPKRLCPAFGTMKRKGAPQIAERPHRRSTFSAPASPTRVPLSALERLAAELRAEVAAAAPPAAAPARAERPAAAPPAADDPFARANAVPVRDVLAWLGLLDGEQPTCPGCRERDGTSVAIVGNGLRCMHARCAGEGHPSKPGFYSVVDLAAKARGCKPIKAVKALAKHFRFDVPPRPERPAPTGATAWKGRFLRDSTDQFLVKVTENAVLILGCDERWKGVIAWDDFGQRVCTTRPPPWEAEHSPVEAAAGPWTDSDTVRAQGWLQRAYGLKLGTQSVYDAVRVVAERTRLHAVREYLSGLRWDGEPRLDRWLSRYLGAEETAYVASVGRWFLVSAVARVMRPGCKVDTMPVLEGLQGSRKSSALRALFGGDWFSDTPIDMQSKDRFGALRGLWCIEIAELDSFRGADANRIKSFLSSQVDRYRPPYARTDAAYPRACVVAGSTNSETYLHDETGNRRFWPVKCGQIDLDGLTRDRDQVWAEAVAAWEGGARWWPEAADARLCAAETGKRMQTDEWEARVLPELERVRSVCPLDPYVSVGDLLRDKLAVEPKDWTQQAQNRVVRILVGAGWTRARRRVSKVATWVYVAPPASSDPTDPTCDPTSK